MAFSHVSQGFGRVLRVLQGILGLMLEVCVLGFKRHHGLNLNLALSFEGPGLNIYTRRHETGVRDPKLAHKQFRVTTDSNMRVPGLRIQA